MGTGAERILVIGIGNEHRGDDAAGLLVARALRQRGLPGVSIVEAQNDGMLLIDLWAGAEKVYLVDAVSSGARPGSLLRLDALRRIPAAGKLRCSTHGLGIEAAIELARALNRFPREFMIHGIEAAKFGVGDAISPEVERGVEETVAAILKDLGHGDGQRRSCMNGD
jgi:hydrogenase maturation protease